MGTMRGAHSLLGSLIHELGHNFMNKEDRDFMMVTFGQRYNKEGVDLDERHFFYEVYAELVSQAVTARNFTEDEIAPWIERQRLGHKGVYDFLDTLSEEDKKMIVDRQHPARVAARSSVQTASPNRLEIVRMRLANMFQRREK